MNSESFSVLIIDNYDSFTFNLVHYLEAMNCEVRVVRNDELQKEIIDKFHKIVISPGPGLPDEAGQLKRFIKEYAPTKSILGICLGQQAIAEVFGGELVALPEVKHGVSTQIKHSSNDYIYDAIPELFQAGLYFSWHTARLSKDLVPTAFASDGTIMSLKHSVYDVKGIQYHPESIMTQYGKTIIKNWLYNSKKN